MKICSRCKLTKDYSAFSKKTANKDGYAYRCKLCRSEVRKSKKVVKVGKKKVEVVIKHKTINVSPPPPSKLPTKLPAGTCHQKIRRDQTEAEDRSLGYNFNLKASDFKLDYELLTKEHIQFIERYEWLGKIGWAVKWCFTARYDGKLAGVVLMSEPTMATKFKQYEVLIQRGAASSWAPKNLNSMLVMFSCRWMVKNTNKRLFTCYSDPTAGEVGTIYQACGFMYLGQGWGVTKGRQLLSGKIVSDREFTKTSSMKKWARSLGIKWESSWCKANGYQNITAYPPVIRQKLTEYAKIEMNKYPIIKQEAKGKYALILGVHRKEQRELNELIKFKTFPYPKRIC